MFSPLIVVMDFDAKTGNAGLRPITWFENIGRAIGIRMPTTVAAGSTFKSFKAIRESRFIQNRPIVFFPECTRSNGKGVLELPTEAVEFVQNALWADNFKVHAIRVDFGLTAASQQPYNSVDVTGIKHSLIMLAQLTNKMTVQYLFNLQDPAQCGNTKTMSIQDLRKRL